MRGSNITFIEAGIDPDLREQAETILRMLGMTPSTAITQFYTQIVLQHGIPFELKLPSNQT